GEMMNRWSSFVLSVMWVVIVSCFIVTRMQAQQAQPATPSLEQAQKAGPPDSEKDVDDDDADIFNPEPSPALQPGMTGADTNDPRFKLTPGIYDAGETAMGIQHLLLLHKPGAFELGATDPDDPKVEKIIGQMGVGNNKKIPKAAHLLIAQLAFAN